MNKKVAYILVVLYGIIAVSLVGLYLQFICQVPLPYIKEWVISTNISDILAYPVYWIPLCLLCIPPCLIYLPLTLWDWNEDVHWSAYILPGLLLVFWIIKVILLSWSDHSDLETKYLETICFAAIGVYIISQVVERIHK